MLVKKPWTSNQELACFNLTTLLGYLTIFINCDKTENLKQSLDTSPNPTVTSNPIQTFGQQLQLELTEVKEKKKITAAM